MFNSDYNGGQGKIYLAILDALGHKGPFRWVGDVSKFEITQEQKWDIITESYSGLRTEAVRIPMGTTVGVNFTLLSYHVENMILATKGSSDGRQVAGTVTAEDVEAFNEANTASFLAHINVSDVVLSKASTVYVEGTDYVVDSINGKISYPVGSTVFGVGTSAKLKVDYSYDAFDRVEAATRGTTNYALMYEGINMVDMSPSRVEVYKLSTDMAKTIQLIDEKHSELPMTGSALIDPSRPVGQQFWGRMK